MSVVEKVDQLQMDKTNNDELIAKRDSSANTDQEDTKKYLRRTTSGFALKKHSLVPVSSWYNIPSKNPNTKSPSERHSEFNYSDYSRPRTRPPSHN